MAEPVERLMARIFEEESDFVWRILRRFGVATRDAEDLAHEVFLTAWRRLADFDRSRPVRPWLFGIAFRIAARFRDLAHNKRELLGERPPEPVGAASQESALHARQLLHAALQPLDLDRRAVFVMHDMEGWSMPELAEALAIPLNTGYSRLRLARKQIKSNVAQLRAAGAQP